jgi:2-polyprenyl-6-methoxyphenol hydroxylase-like FAD-dependent oxidoreductase
MEADIVIIGGGPAGMMAGLLFARAGIDTLVLEKHGDFLRDFRGDTVHPSTMEILDQLGMLERFLKRPHTRIDQAGLRVAGMSVVVGDLRYLKTPAPFVAMMPQWEFLDFLRNEATAFPAFHVAMNAGVSSLTEDSGRITGATLANGKTVHARKLVIAADGRQSIVRLSGGLAVTVLGAPMDIFWFSLPKHNASETGIRGIFEAGRILVLIDRGSYWQCAYVFPKGAAEVVRARGIAAIRTEIETALPDFGSLADALTSMDQMHLLSVALDRLDRWHRPGLLAIGDAAHAMSPLGGIGINLAIQDAVAAANILAKAMLTGADTDRLLAAVQKRRLWPTRAIQFGQKMAQDNIIGTLLNPRAVMTKPPLAVRLLNRFAWLRRIPGRIIGLGIRRERVTAPAA